MPGIIAARLRPPCHTPDGHRVNCAAIAAQIPPPQGRDSGEHPHGMERLAENIVAWHNRHPLARRIRAQDVHTIGVVSLPFLRQEAPPQEPVEPSLGEPTPRAEPLLTEAIDPAQLQAGGAQAGAEAASTQASPAEPPVGDVASSPAAAAWSSTGGSQPSSLRKLLATRQTTPSTSAPGKTGSRHAFNERFVPELSVRRVAAFALEHGYSAPPASKEALPWRVVSPHKGAGEGWPYEIYLLSAGIDVGTSRTRVLAGRGMPAPILGRRLLDPRKVAAAVLAAVVLAGGAAYGWWRAHASPEPSLPAVAAAASAASAVVAPAASAAPEPAASAAAAAAAASEAATPASAASEVSPPDAAQSDEPPDIRPHLIPELGRRDGRPRPPLLRSEPAASSAGSGAKAAAADDKAKPGPQGTAPEPDSGKPDTGPRGGEPARDSAPSKAIPLGAATSGKGGSNNNSSTAVPAPRSVVALVGPPGSKAEAEASLKLMRNALSGLHSNPDSLQAMVIETPQGWRATVWPFASREQAQLINAVLVARGLRTRAIDF